jgi:hypothetical protein
MHARVACAVYRTRLSCPECAAARLLARPQGSLPLTACLVASIKSKWPKRGRVLVPPAGLRPPFRASADSRGGVRTPDPAARPSWPATRGAQRLGILKGKAVHVNALLRRISSGTSARPALPAVGTEPRARTADMVFGGGAGVRLDSAPAPDRPRYFGGFATTSIDANQAASASMSASASGFAITAMTSLLRLPDR